MKTNIFSVTFWFNIYDNHKEMLSVLQNDLKDEYSNYNINNYTNNYLNPIITAFNKELKTNMAFSQINFQYNMDNVSINDLPLFKEKVLHLYEILTNNGISILHTAIFVNAEIIDEDALNKISKNIISSSLADDDLVDVSLKVGKKHEDLFYKILTVLNKKQIKLPQKVDELGRNIPLPLISWNGAMVENEIIEISYEINDKYLFDYTSDYHTTEFYLNKMLYIFENNFESDVKDLLEKGYF